VLVATQAGIIQAREEMKTYTREEKHSKHVVASLRRSEKRQKYRVVHRAHIWHSSQRAAARAHKAAGAAKAALIFTRKALGGILAEKKSAEDDYTKSRNLRFKYEVAQKGMRTKLERYNKGEIQKSEAVQKTIKAQASPKAEMSLLGKSWVPLKGDKGGWKAISVGDHGVVCGVKNAGTAHCRHSVTPDFQGGPWTRLAGGPFDDIAVGPAGIWAVRKGTGRVVRRAGVGASHPWGTSWVEVPGRCHGITVGISSVCCVGREEAASHAAFCRRNVGSSTQEGLSPDGGKWEGIGGDVSTISTGDGQLWAVSPSQEAYVRTGVTATKPFGTQWTRARLGREVSSFHLGGRRVCNVATDHSVQCTTMGVGTDPAAPTFVELKGLPEYAPAQDAVEAAVSARVKSDIRHEHVKAKAKAIALKALRDAAVAMRIHRVNHVAEHNAAATSRVNQVHLDMDAAAGRQQHMVPHPPTTIVTDTRDTVPMKKVHHMLVAPHVPGEVRAAVVQQQLEKTAAAELRNVPAHSEDALPILPTDEEEREADRHELQATATAHIMGKLDRGLSKTLLSKDDSHGAVSEDEDAIPLVLVQEPATEVLTKTEATSSLASAEVLSEKLATLTAKPPVLDMTVREMAARLPTSHTTVATGASGLWVLRAGYIFSRSGLRAAPSALAAIASERATKVRWSRGDVRAARVQERSNKAFTRKTIEATQLAERRERNIKVDVGQAKASQRRAQRRKDAALNSVESAVKSHEMQVKRVKERQHKMKLLENSGGTSASKYQREGEQKRGIKVQNKARARTKARSKEREEKAVSLTAVAHQRQSIVKELSGKARKLGKVISEKQEKRDALGKVSELARKRLHVKALKLGKQLTVAHDAKNAAQHAVKTSSTEVDALEVAQDMATDSAEKAAMQRRLYNRLRKQRGVQRKEQRKASRKVQAIFSRVQAIQEAISKKEVAVTKATLKAAERDGKARATGQAWHEAQLESVRRNADLSGGTAEAKNENTKEVNAKGRLAEQRMARRKEVRTKRAKRQAEIERLRAVQAAKDHEVGAKHAAKVAAIAEAAQHRIKIREQAWKDHLKAKTQHEKKKRDAAKRHADATAAALLGAQQRARAAAKHGLSKERGRKRQTRMERSIVRSDIKHVEHHAVAVEVSSDTSQHKKQTTSQQAAKKTAKEAAEIRHGEEFIHKNMATPRAGHRMPRIHLPSAAPQQESSEQTAMRQWHSHIRKASLAHRAKEAEPSSDHPIDFNKYLEPRSGLEKMFDHAADIENRQHLRKQRRAAEIQTIKARKAEQKSTMQESHHFKSLLKSFGKFAHRAQQRPIKKTIGHSKSLLHKAVTHQVTSVGLKAMHGANSHSMPVHRTQTGDSMAVEVANDAGEIDKDVAEELKEAKTLEKTENEPEELKEAKTLEKTDDDALSAARHEAEASLRDTDMSHKQVHRKGPAVAVETGSQFGFRAIKRQEKADATDKADLQEEKMFRKGMKKTAPGRGTSSHHTTTHRAIKQTRRARHIRSKARKAFKKATTPLDAKQKRVVTSDVRKQSRTDTKTEVKRLKQAAKDRSDRKALNSPALRKALKEADNRVDHHHPMRQRKRKESTALEVGDVEDAASKALKEAEALEKPEANYFKAAKVVRKEEDSLAMSHVEDKATKAIKEAEALEKLTDEHLAEANADPLPHEATAEVQVTIGSDEATVESEAAEETAVEDKAVAMETSVLKEANQMGKSRTNRKAEAEADKEIAADEDKVHEIHVAQVEMVEEQPAAATALVDDSLGGDLDAMKAEADKADAELDDLQNQANQASSFLEESEEEVEASPMLRRVT
jgi:hypothetical protein